MKTYQRIGDAGILEILAKMNAVHKGHFQGTSGAHLSAYVNKDAPGSSTNYLMMLAFELAHRIKEQCDLEKDDIIAVVGAPMGAISLGAFTAYWLNQLFPRADGVEILSFYAEKTSLTDDKAPFRLRDYYGNQIKDRGVISVEDLLNTGDSAKKMIELILMLGGIPVGVGALCNRGEVTPTYLGARFLASLIDLPLERWDVHLGAECPLCKSRVPMRVDLGHGRSFIASNPDYPVAVLPA